MIRPETRYAAGRVLYRVLRPYWRLRRGVTLGAQGIVLDEAGRVLLIRHTYKPGWWFPGGGVEPGEAAETSMRRELREEALIEVIGRPMLHGIFTNFASFPGDHIAVFIVRAWRRTEGKPRTNEIEAVAWFAMADLPPDINPNSRRRLAEVCEDAERSEVW